MFEEFPGSCRGSSSSSSESIDLCFLSFGGSLGCFSATVFFHFCCGSCLRDSSRFCGDLERSRTRFCGSTVAEPSSTFCEDERGGVCSRDLDLSSLLKRPLCSADRCCGPADGDEGFISENSSSDVSSASEVTIS